MSSKQCLNVSWYEITNGGDGGSGDSGDCVGDGSGEGRYNVNDDGSAFDSAAGGGCVDSGSHGNGDNDGDDGGNADSDHCERKVGDGEIMVELMVTGWYYCWQG